MIREFSRKELHDLVWAQPIRTVAADLGMSDVALAKQCKKADIPVPSRGYWARKQAGKPTIEIALPLRFPGASDRVGASSNHHYCGADWPERFLEMPVPLVPAFDEEMSSVAGRGRKLAGKIRCPRQFGPTHPLVSKLLAHDEERRQEFAKWGSSYYAPRYSAGAERRRLLIINALFIAAARLGCRPSMSTSKYGQDPGSEREISITIGVQHVCFTIEAIKSGKDAKKERLRLAFGTSREQTTTSKLWEDNESRVLEDQLTDIFVEMLISAEMSYRESLTRNRQWIIERKSAAAAELRRREEDAERKSRELQRSWKGSGSGGCSLRPGLSIARIRSEPMSTPHCRELRKFQAHRLTSTAGRIGRGERQTESIR